MNERAGQTDPEVMRDLLRAASTDPQQTEALITSLIEQAQHDPVVDRALIIATYAALRSTPRAE